MFGSNRGDRGALIAFVTSLVAIVLVAWVNQPSNPEVAKQDSSNLEDDTKQYIRNPRGGTDDFDLWEDTFPQWVMAIFTMVATGISWMAVVYVRKTLAETQSSLNIARLTLEETQRTNVAMTRPYLFLIPTESDVPKPFTRDGEVSFAFKNCGQSPALNAAIEMEHAISVRPIGDFEISLSGVRGRYGDIGPGVTIRDTIRANLSPEYIGAISAGDVYMVRLRLTYELPTGGKDAHDVTFMLDRDHLHNSRFRLISDEERKRQR